MIRPEFEDKLIDLVSQYIKWQEGMRVTGKMTMPVNDYGEYLARSGKRHHNILRRKRLMKAS